MYLIYIYGYVFPVYEDSIYQYSLLYIYKLKCCIMLYYMYMRMFCIVELTSKLNSF